MHCDSSPFIHNIPQQVQDKSIDGTIRISIESHLFMQLCSTSAIVLKPEWVIENSSEITMPLSFAAKYAKSAEETRFPYRYNYGEYTEVQSPLERRFQVPLRDEAKFVPRNLSLCRCKADCMGDWSEKNRKDCVIEFVEIHGDHIIKLPKYKYRLQSETGDLITRWGNVPHHHDVSSFPHHKHDKNGVQFSV